MMPKDLNEHCAQHASQYTSAAACLKQKSTQYANKIFRASADCTAGTITTTEDQRYTLDGVWAKDDIGAGRTRWRDAEGKVVPTNLADNGLSISAQWETLCPGPVTPALIAKAKGARAAAAQAARGQRAWDMDLTVREINEVAPGQYRFGTEHALQLKALAPANVTAGTPAGGKLAQVSRGAAPPAASATPSPGAAPQVAANPGFTVGKE
jgi:hypothetical protein